MRGRLAAAVACLALMSSGSAHASEYVSMSGKQICERFCAACHGVAGKGDGPVSASLTVEVPDLTLIARRSGGKYPRDRIARVIDGRHIFAAHGSRTMPVWGEDLSRLEIGDPNAERIAQTIIVRLADYVWLLQKPDPSQ
jgi:mono/diheme cytochrome c family protein